MSRDASISYAQLYHQGHFGSQVDTLKSSHGLIDLLEIESPGGDVSRPAVSDIVLYQEMRGGSPVQGDVGGGRFSFVARRGELLLAAPDVAIDTIADASHRVRSLAFPFAEWRSTLEEASDGKFSVSSSLIYGRNPDSAAIRAAVQKLWSICEQEGAPSRLLSRAAGCEIFAELCRHGGASFAPAKGGLAAWAERRCKDMLHSRLADDISLDELAAEAQLSSFHFARMFKQTFGVPPRVYLTKLRIEKACELLERTDMPVTEIALAVGYASNQALARVFAKYRHLCPSDYRRMTRDESRVYPIATPVDEYPVVVSRLAKLA